MFSRVVLVGGFNGGAGRTLTAAILAHGIHLLGRPAVLVRQSHAGSVSIVDPIESALRVPCYELRLPDPYLLPSDMNVELKTLIQSRDERFMSALDELAQAIVGPDGAVVVDLCSHAQAMNSAALSEAATILLPARESVFEIDWSLRAAAHARGTLHNPRMAVPTLIAAIAPDNRRDSQEALLGRMLRESDPDQEIWPDDPTDVVVHVPFLDEVTLQDLYDEKPIWDDLAFQHRCQAFAQTVLRQASSETDRLWNLAHGA